jgi:AcrR family transcriptional regulator
MGIKERQERDREAVRRAILDAARELFVAEGYQNVSIRKIAERIEYSPAAIYSYFPSKDDIFFALAEEGFRLLGGPVDPSSDTLPLASLDRIRVLFQNLYDFSRNHPQYFTLMFLDPSVPRIIREYERFEFVREMKSSLVAQVQRCIDEKALPTSVDPMVALHLLTVAVLGVAGMRLSDRGPTEIADELAHDVINVVLAGLQSGIHLHSAAALYAAAEEQQVGVSK